MTDSTDRAPGYRGQVSGHAVQVTIGEGRWTDVHASVRVGHLARINVLPGATRAGAPGVFVLVETSTGERMVGTCTLDMWDTATRAARGMAEYAGMIDPIGPNQPVVGVTNDDGQPAWLDMATGNTCFAPEGTDPNDAEAAIGLPTEAPAERRWRRLFVEP